MRWYVYKQSTRKLSRSWLPTTKYACPDERAPWLRNPVSRLLSCLHPSVAPSLRQASSQALTRQLGAKYDKLSRESPRVTASKNIYSPNAPVGRPTPPTVSICRTRHPLRLPCPTLSRKDSYPPVFLFGSARTRLFAGQRYLHKSAMQSLFIFRESMARVHTTCT